VVRRELLGYILRERNGDHRMSSGGEQAEDLEAARRSRSATAMVDEIRRRAGGGRRISFVSGNFNVLHPGHLRILKFAADNGDFLVVGINPDRTAGVTVPAEFRLEGMRSIAMVDYALLLDEAPEDFIALLKPEIVVKGKEHQLHPNPEQAVVGEYGGKLLFSSGEMRFASINLLQRDYVETNFSTIQKPLDFATRRGFDVAQLAQLLPRLAGIRVLVIDDLIVDTYINCDPLGMSQEDPTIVVTPIESKSFVGGAGIVAAHARGLGAEVRFVTVVGGDETTAFVQKSLADMGVAAEMFPDTTRPTTVKQRFRAHGKTLLRVNHLRQHPVGPEVAAKMLASIERHLPTTDLLLFSDFNYGCLPQSLVDSIVGLAAVRGVMMAADSQASSQISDISRFRGMALITPTEREARLALRDSESGLVILGEKLHQTAKATNVVITLGSEGLLIHAAHAAGYATDRLPAFNTAPKDVAGAGDSLFTCTSLALCAGIDVWRSIYLGSVAAACQVSRVGNTPLQLTDLTTELKIPSIQEF
jgi:rfaE bifunctional protein kinase chain/domain